MSLAAGTKLGPYEILAPLGAGGMGEVYRARDAKLGREIAIKVLSGATASDPDRRQRFELEARAASALNHPNILTVHDIGEADGTVYIAMELVEGKTLRELVVSGEPPGVYVRKLDGSPAVRLADGEGYGFSPDGRFALTVKLPERRPIVLVPTGVGESKTLDVGNITFAWANWFPDGKRILVNGREGGKGGARLFVLDVSGGGPKAISPEGVSILGQSISPDGKSIVARGSDGRVAIYPADGAASRARSRGSSPRTSRCAGRPTGARSTSRGSRRCPGSSTSWTSRPGVGRSGRNSSRSTQAASSRPDPR